MKNKLNCVLLIDDDEPANYLSRMILDGMNCSEQVQEVSSGKDALNYLTRSGCAAGNQAFPCPDLIFLDINMPAMNGWEFLEEYGKLEQERKGKIVVVMLTTSLNPADSERAGAVSEIAGFETKPLTAPKLEKILRKYFSAKYEGD